MAPGENVLVVDDPPMPVTSGRTTVLFCCTGLEHSTRGIETFFREAFDGLKARSDLEIALIKGSGNPAQREYVAGVLRRTSRCARWLGRVVRRNGYIVEQWSCFVPTLRLIRRLQPSVIFYSDANLGYLLYWLRQGVGGRYKLLFSNGGPCSPPFIRTDFVHQVTPYYVEQAAAYGEPAWKHFMVPYGFRVPHTAPQRDTRRRESLRRHLGLPADRPILLSVGWIARQHKRMDYVLSEVASWRGPRPFLVLLGEITPESREVIELARRIMPATDYTVRSVAYREVPLYYQCADVFVLASLKEGFGRVFCEALSHGLPVVAHRHPVMEFVLGPFGIFGKLDEPGELRQLVRRALEGAGSSTEAIARWEWVRDHFGWDVLGGQYAAMFHACSQRYPCGIGHAG